MTTFNPAADFPENSEIYVNIAPYNSAGIAAGCIENIFITESIIPNCTNLSFPHDGATNISVSSDVIWNSISNASGYIISIGTISNGTNIINSLDVGNITSFNPVTDFPDDSQIFVTITPYNAAGKGISCAEESFITENRSLIIPKYFTPNGDGYNDTWVIQDPKNEIKNIYIYNRYGRLIKSITDISIGWNGNISGKPLITDDYWCSIELFSGKVIRKHFTLKR